MPELSAGMTFSVIIPTYNRLKLLQGTLASLYRQDFKDFEIIVVSDGSTDGTDGYLTRIAAEGRIKYVRQSNQGLAATRSAGLKIAEGEYVAFTDDDCTVPADWLRRIQEIFQRHEISGVGGACRTGDLSNPYAEAND